MLVSEDLAAWVDTPVSAPSDEDRLKAGEMPESSAEVIGCATKPLSDVLEPFLLRTLLEAES